MILYAMSLGSETVIVSIFDVDTSSQSSNTFLSDKLSTQLYYYKLYFGKYALNILSDM